MFGIHFQISSARISDWQDYGFPAECDPCQSPVICTDWRLAGITGSRLDVIICKDCG